ncbi:hypothetical protein ABB37_04612 [Leptomonas pyrrhocoris]|uniref:Exonuclease domain-containing protein n=1 Tax=Leptomonas pyrrhocoris TaxID=157538 RepID=A0A0N0VF69_LEPPY|nr:hypothetical protein ABB37_04612 [Leptomonas pyrrhocoris]XP_015658784.1 hypothetical protein ABB37_04612 [Leptomonas pyrrhocoris]KPA80344.1 hypothetical protein ABB37_04612 [Leptomonas pyrrhocoris]KPA80345.1 hypothetical protein ABB37_04612 [Leptomonas pyrrhocoris]|eukprot:XP_015658783.1 hypothetical protein ABB37_04612 [Leptomonas pyrrhocoris]
MLFALPVTDVNHGDNSMLSGGRPTAAGESGDRRTPSLVPLSHRHGGDRSRRSSSPLAVSPESTGAAERQEVPPPSLPLPAAERSKAESISSSCSAEVMNPPPQRQSTQPRAMSTSLTSVGVNEHIDAVPQPSTKAVVAAAVELRASASSSSPTALPQSLRAVSDSAELSKSHNLHLGGTTSATAITKVDVPAAVADASGSKTPKRVLKTTSTTHAHRRANESGGSDSSGGGVGSRSASERCKAARTLAAELMSALMERPPQTAQIAQYRKSMRSSASSTPKPALDNAAAAAVAVDGNLCDSLAESSSAVTAAAGGVRATAAPLPSASASAASHSFIDAVRNGRAKSSHTPSSSAFSSSAAATAEPVSTAAHGKTATTSPTVALKASGGTPLHAPTAAPPTVDHNSIRRRNDSPNPLLLPAGATEGFGRQPFELMPEDASRIPELLSVLREIALSGASLDPLCRPANSSASTPRRSNNSGSATSAGPPATTSASPPKMATTGAATTPQTTGTANGTAAAASGAVGPPRPPHAVETNYYEEQWQRVRAHLQAVRGLVLNRRELASTLDEVLGVDWRVTPATAAAAVESAESQHGTEGPGNNDPLSVPTTAADVLHSAAERVTVDVVVPVMPTPVDHDGPTRLAAKGERSAKEGAAAARGATSTTNTAASRDDNTGVGNRTNTTVTTTTTFTMTTTTVTTTTITATTLNHNARPFQTRTPSTFQRATSTQSGGSPPLSTLTGSASPSSPPVAVGGDKREDTAAAGAHLGGNIHADANNASSSMQQLSELSSTYSPSQHVTTFLERSTPPATGRLADEGDAGLFNFPSTPLSEAAVPYQPSVTLVGGTSPRGANASTSSSPPFHLESREEMLRRRSAAPNAFYASMTHGGATHYLGGPPSAATTPGTFVSASVPPGSPPFALPGSGARSMPVSPLLSYGSPVTAAQCPYDYVLVLDFEATCEEHPPPNYLYEIIEFPVVLVDVRLQRVVAEFHRFVRPRYKVELSSFCKKLTGMRQADVDAAPSLEEVILQFERWFAHTLPPHSRCVFATDGPMDMREFMYHHSVSRQGIRFPPLFYQYVDVKQIFAGFFHCSQGKIKAMLEVLHVPFEGRLHSGLDDARNIASIVIALLQYGCTLCEVPLNRLPLNRLLLSSPTVTAADSGSTPLSLPPSTAATGSGRRRPNGASPTCITAPYAVDEDEYSY